MCFKNTIKWLKFMSWLLTSRGQICNSTIASLKSEKKANCGIIGFFKKHSLVLMCFRLVQNESLLQGFRHDCKPRKYFYL